jgi:hypothetical protein
MVTAIRVDARGMARIVEVDDDLDVGIEVGSGTPDSELGALGLGTEGVTQEVDEAPALPKRPFGIADLARGGRRFASRNSSQSDEV